jgi:hypothetical protein
MPPKDMGLVCDPSSMMSSKSPRWPCVLHKQLLVFESSILVDRMFHVKKMRFEVEGVVRSARLALGNFLDVDLESFPRERQ